MLDQKYTKKKYCRFCPKNMKDIFPAKLNNMKMLRNYGKCSDF